MPRAGAGVGRATVRRGWPVWAVASLAAAVLVSPTAAVAAPVDELTVAGVVDLGVVDGPPVAGQPAGATEKTVVMVAAAGQTLTVPAAESAGLRDGQKVVVEIDAPAGTTPAEAVAAAAADDPAVELTDVVPTAGTQVQATAVGHSITVLPVYWAAPDGQTLGSLTTLADRTVAYWEEQSRGQLDVNATVRDWAPIATPSGSCPYDAIRNAALAAHGVSAPTSAAEHVLVYFPRRTDCGWAGLGSILGSNIWVNGYPMLDVTAHELGHNLGIGHANTATCTAGGLRVPLSPTCTVTSYGDTADVMGSARYAETGSLNAAFADHLGFIDTVTATTAAPVTVDLAPLSGTGGPYAVKVPTPSGDVFVDFRPAAGRDTRQPHWAGVQVHLRTQEWYPSTRLLDMQPWSTSAFGVASLPTWSVWQVPGAGLAVHVSAVGTTARVRVVPTASDTLAPTPATVTTPAPSGLAASASTVTWRAGTDAGSGVAAYAVAVDGKVTARLAPTALSHPLPALASGAHTVQVNTVDAAGNTAVGTRNSFTVSTTASATPPSVTAPADGAVLTASSLTSGRATVTWSVASPPTSTQVLLDGRLVGTVTDPAVRTLALPVANGAHHVAVRTYAAGGVLTGVSSRVNFTVDTAPPAAPRTLTLSSADRLSWLAAGDVGSGVDRYRVSRDGVAVLETRTLYAAVSTPEGRHTWSVVAIDRAGHVSPAASLSVLRDSSPPTTPVITAPVTGSALTASTVTVSWTASTDGDTGVVAYRVTVNGVQKAQLPPTTRTVRLALGQGSSALRVIAVNGGGTAATSAAVPVTVDSIVPTRPAGLALSAGDRLTWQASVDSGSGVARYIVARNGVTVAETSALALDVTTPLGRHTWTVTAVDGYGSRATTALVVIRDLSAPPAPTLTSPTPAASLTSASVRMAWTAVTDAESGIAGYRVSVNGGAPKQVSTAYAVVVVPQGASRLTVVAVNGAGTPSAPVSVDVTVDSLAPSAPGGLALSTADRLTWSASVDAGGGAVSYDVALDGVRVAQTTGLAANVATPQGRHTWLVTAVDAVGNKRGTALVVVRDSSAPPAPTLVSPASGTTVSALSVTATWRAPIDPESGISGYRVTVNGAALRTVLTTNATVAVSTGVNDIRVVAVNKVGLVSAPLTVRVNRVG